MGKGMFAHEPPQGRACFDKDSLMDATTYHEPWVWVCLTLLVFVLLSPSAVFVGLALW